MNEKLLKEAFKKAKKETGSNKLTHWSNHLSDFIYSDSSEPYGEKSLRDRYNLIKNDKTQQIDLKSYVRESLSHYLKYDSFSDFKKDYEKSKNPIAIWISKNKISISISTGIVILLIIFSINFFDKQQWMVWQENEYVEVKFDTNTYNLNQLKLYKEERIKHFKKITPDCNYDFFNSDGSPRVWYGKNRKRELEYFTDLGLHPETGETLKKITSYMIRTHICAN